MNNINPDSGFIFFFLYLFALYEGIFKMIKSIKLNKNYFLYGVLSVNLLVFISFITYILFLNNLLPESLIILVYPFFLLSENTFIVIITLIVESLLIGMYYTKTRKQKLDPNVEENIELKIEHSFDELINDKVFDHKEEHLDTGMSSDIDFHTINTQIKYLSENNDILVQNKDDYDLSPQFLESNEDLIQEELPFSTDIEVDQTVQKIKIESHNFDRILNDFQFAFYKNIVESGWLYEKVSDRGRIGFDKYAIDESKISLADLDVLLNSKAIYREQIHHPTGQFYAYSTVKNIEKSIIFETVRRIVRTKRLKFIKRKIIFPNWNEFGLTKQTWQFDFEIPQSNIIGCIWSKDCFLDSDNKSGEKKLLSERKNILKALIAAVTLKLKDEGTAIIITSLKENAVLLKKIIKSTGWGEVKVLCFSNHSFFNEFDKLLKNQS